MITINVNDRTVNLMRAEYKKALNDVSFFEAVFTVTDDVSLTDTNVGNEVEVFDGNVLKVKGKIKKRKILSGNSVIILGYGFEREFATHRCPLDSGTRKVYTSTNDNAIFDDLITSVSGWSVDVSGSTIVSIDSFRTTKSMSVWRGIKRLADLVGKDINIDYDTKTVQILDKKGRIDHFVYNEGKEISDISVEETEAEYTKVIVYGKGDGNSQVIGEAGTGNSIREVIDRNIITIQEANQRAEKELDAIENNTENYTFSLNNPFDDIIEGDSGTLVSNLLGELNVDVVMISKKIQPDGEEELIVEVSNPEYRRAIKNLQRSILESEEELAISETSMQGNTNVLTFSEMINANNTAPLRVFAYLPSSFIYDESGNNRVNLFELDYQISPFRSGVGNATEDSVAPWVSGTSSDNDAEVTGSTSTIGAGTNGYFFGNYYQNVSNDGDNTWTNVGTSVNLANAPYFFHGVYGVFEIEVDAGAGQSWATEYRVRLRKGTSSDYWPNSSGLEVAYRHAGEGTFRDKSTFFLFAPTDWQNETIRLQYKISNDNYWTSGTQELIYSYVGNRGHLHGDGSLEAANHNHGDGNYRADSHDHNVGISESISDSASVNASQVSEIALYFYNTSTSSWDLKHTITNTGTTFDTDVDISNSGTYPDAAGTWKVEIKTNNSNADLVQASVKCRHEIDY